MAVVRRSALASAEAVADGVTIIGGIITGKGKGPQTCGLFLENAPGISAGPSVLPCESSLSIGAQDRSTGDIYRRRRHANRRANRSRKARHLHEGERRTGGWVLKKVVARSEYHRSVHK
jgi:hypothetical protein